LLEAGVTVRALARDPGSAGLPDGVDVVRGDLSEPDTVEANLTGIDAVFLVWPFGTAEGAPPIVHAIASHAAASSTSPRQACTTMSTSRRNRSPISTLSWSGCSRNPRWTGRSCAPVDSRAIPAAGRGRIRADGVVRAPYGAAARSLIHERDIATWRRALSGHGHGGRKYVLIGPATLTQVEQAHAIGRPVRYEEISPEAALEQMVAEGWPRTFAEGALNAWAGLVTEPEVVTSTVEEVTAVSARTFGQWAIDYAGEFS
jgi:uncharacterized protein YbjT (DUF2867 family)